MGLYYGPLGHLALGNCFKDTTIQNSNDRNNHLKSNYFVLFNGIETLLILTIVFTIAYVGSIFLLLLIRKLSRPVHTTSNW